MSKGQRQLYSVYLRKTGLPVITYGTVYECAEAMRVTPETFRSTLTDVRKGRCKKWEIVVESDAVANPLQIEVDGEMVPLTDLSIQTGIPYHVLWYRFRMGKPTKEILRKKP